MAALFFIALVLAASAIWRLAHKPQANALLLTHARFSDLHGWNTVDPRDALASFVRSCGVMRAAPPQTAVGAYAGTVADWRAVCDAASKADANAARDFFEQYFAPMAVSGDALFTGYYEPELHASLARHGRYQTPVLSLPDDLVTVDLGRFGDKFKGEHITGRVESRRLVPYPTREAIDEDAPRTAKILFYADDPVAVFFLHIQGSGRDVRRPAPPRAWLPAGQNGAAHHGHRPHARSRIASNSHARQDFAADDTRLASRPSRQGTRGDGERCVVCVLQAWCRSAMPRSAPSWQRKRRRAEA